MNITVTGGSGLVGRRVIERLLDDGHALTVLGRSSNLNPPVRSVTWDAVAGEPPEQAIQGADAVIHLAGEPVSQRWNAEVKRRIADSRVAGTRHLVQALSIHSRRPAVLVSASAVGYYGDRGDELLTEQSDPGEGFLPRVCADWENQARLAEALGIRTIMLRIGIVLGQGGALQKMVRPFRAGLGATLGSGKQWMSWIHIEDLVALILFGLDKPEAQGPMNAVSPTPVRNREFTKALAETLHRPAVLAAPHFGLKVLFGEMADVMTQSQRAIPAAARKAGFEFRYPELKSALESLLSTPTTARP